MDQESVVTSPNYPDNYPNNVRCEYTIEVGPHHVVSVNTVSIINEYHGYNFIDILLKYPIIIMSNIYANKVGNKYQMESSEDDVHPGSDHLQLFRYVCAVQAVYKTSRRFWCFATR